MQCLALGDRLLGDPPLARPARRRRLGELGPVHVLDRVDLGQEELLRQLVAAVHLDLGRANLNTHQTDVSSQQRSPLVLCDKTDCAVPYVVLRAAGQLDHWNLQKIVYKTYCMGYFFTWYISLLFGISKPKM